MKDSNWIPKNWPLTGLKVRKVDGLFCLQIGKTVGVARGSITSWRKCRNLSANFDATNLHVKTWFLAEGKPIPKTDGIGFIASPCIIEISQSCNTQNWENIYYELQKWKFMQSFHNRFYTHRFPNERSIILICRFFCENRSVDNPQKALIPCDISGFLSQSVSFMWWALHRQRKRSGSVLSQPRCRRSEPFLSRQRRIPASQGCFPAGGNWW